MENVKYDRAMVETCFVVTAMFTLLIKRGAPKEVNVLV